MEEKIERSATTIAMTVDKELHKRVFDYAKEEERSISFIIKKALLMYLESKGK